MACLAAAELKTPGLMTIEAIRTARASRMAVLGIGIDGYDVSELYGERWTLNIRDCE